MVQTAAAILQADLWEVGQERGMGTHFVFFQVVLQVKIVVILELLDRAEFVINLAEVFRQDLVQRV